MVMNMVQMTMATTMVMMTRMVTVGGGNNNDVDDVCEEDEGADEDAFDGDIN